MEKIITSYLVDKYGADCGVVSGNTQTISFKDLNAPGCDIEFSGIGNSAEIGITTKCVKEIPASDITKIKEDLKSDVSPEILNDLLTTSNLTSLNSCILNMLNSQKIDFSKVKMTCKDGKPIKVSDVTNNITQNIYYECIMKNSKNTSSTSAPVNSQFQYVLVGSVLLFIFLFFYIFIY